MWKILLLFFAFFKISESQSVNWGQCRQLEPTEAEKELKTKILEKCLNLNPVPTELTEKSVEDHKNRIAFCALKEERWFKKNGEYKYEKAEKEIKAKKLPLEKKILAHHVKCRDEARAKYPRVANVLDQIQLYQACMDFHISESCGIKIE